MGIGSSSIGSNTKSHEKTEFMLENAVVYTSHKNPSIKPTDQILLSSKTRIRVELTVSLDTFSDDNVFISAKREMITVLCEDVY